MEQRIAKTCRQTVDLLEQFCREQNGELVRLAKSIGALFAEGGHLLVAGSGALQPVAQQLASQFAFRLNFDRPALPAVCLGSDAVLTTRMLAAGQLDQHLVRHYRALNSQQHLLLVLNDGTDAEALSNLCEEVLENEQPIALVSFVGASDQLNGAGVDYCLNLATTIVPRQLELTQFIGHLLCELVEAELFGR